MIPDLATASCMELLLVVGGTRLTEQFSPLELHNITAIDITKQDRAPLRVTVRLADQDKTDVRTFLLTVRGWRRKP